MVGSAVRRTLGASALIIVAALAGGSPAAAAVTAPFGADGPSCTTVPASETEPGGERLCTGIVASFDGAPIDVKLQLPPAPADPADDADYPLVMGFHGWGGDKDEYNLSRWTDKGYAAFSMSDRGWGDSCGGQDDKRFQPQCTGTPPGQGGSRGYNHLMDTRFEVRDAQLMAGKLVDEGVVDPDAIGATGPSYGGGISMSLAALNDRTMLGGLPSEENGKLVPWVSPDGTSMHLAAAAPEIPWTDLAYSLVPNGYTLDYASNNTYDQGPFGVLKRSFVSGLYAVGVATSNFTGPETDDSADVNAWYALLTAGEPYEGNPEAEHIAEEVTTYHSSYYIDDSTAPAPLFISNGWTDDLFPVDEAVRFYNRTRAHHPGADISLMFFDHGHARGQNKAADKALLRQRQEAWFDYYLTGQGSKPADQVETLTQTCPSTAPSGGPFTAPTWADLAPGEIRFQSAAGQTVTPGSSSPEASQAFDPIAGGDACATASAEDVPGVANYRLPAVEQGEAFTLMGSPTVVADISSAGPNNQLVARLVDVDSEGQETLVARGVYRPDVTAAMESSRQVFQLHPNGYEFAPGHIAKLELLPSDDPYVRASNGQTPITVSKLDLRLPVRDQPGSPGVSSPAPKVLPPGYQLAGDFGPGPVDSDGDGIDDDADDCVMRPGPASNGGCPKSQAPKHCAEKINGTRRDDKIRGTTESERIQGRRGSDKIFARAGDDCVAGGPGRDAIKAQNGDDVIDPGGGRDKINAGAGRDRIKARGGSVDVIRCGPGRDKAIVGSRDRTRGCERVVRRRRG